MRINPLLPHICVFLNCQYLTVTYLVRMLLDTGHPTSDDAAFVV